jgi:type IV pilus assembly protein PilX
MNLNFANSQYKNKQSLPLQKGVALVVVMIFIVALSLLAVYSANNSNLSERVARNQQDLQLARESAEAALRDAELDLLLPSDARRTDAFCARTTQRPYVDYTSEFLPNCAKGQCGFALDFYKNTNYVATAVAGNKEPWWPASKGGLWNDDVTTKPTAADTNCNFTGGVPYGTYTGRKPVAGVSRQPEYMIEIIYKQPNNLFRINARGFGRNVNTEVVLQTYYKPFR